jgi:hypothetical protein
MSRKFKKLTLQYAYLKLEKEEIEEICLSVEKEMRIYLEEHYPEGYEAFYGPPTKSADEKEIPQPPSCESTIEEAPEESGEEDKLPPPKNKELRNLYRKIAEKTHPDKIGNNDHAELFSQASQAYADNDIATLLDIAGRTNVEIDELSETSILLLEKNIQNISKEITTKKETTAWAWHKAETEEQKEVIIKYILEMKGM